MKEIGFFKDLHPFAKFLMLLAIAFLSFIVVTLIGSLALIPFLSDDGIGSILSGFDFSDEKGLNILKYMQTISHFGLFIIPSLIFAWLVGGNIVKYFGLNKRINILYFLLSVLLIINAVPLINYFIEINSRLTLPDSMSNIEEWMKRTEESAMEVTERFLSVSTIGGLMFNIFMIAIIPAIGEELVFRGIVLRLFNQWSKNIHIAVWVSAILFSAMHLQFYGFLPRLFLGAILGYMFVWSGNIWIPIFAHFANNAMAIISYYLIHNKYWDVDYDKVGEAAIAPVYIVLSIIMTTIILFIFYRYYYKNIRVLKN